MLYEFALPGKYVHKIIHSTKISFSLIFQKIGTRIIKFQHACDISP
jgi:hypothetical protein